MSAKQKYMIISEIRAYRTIEAESKEKAKLHVSRLDKELVDDLNTMNKEVKFEAGTYQVTYDLPPENVR